MNPCLLSLLDFEREALRRLDPATAEYFQQGSGDEVTLRASRASWSSWKLWPRALVDVESVDTATALIGNNLAWPVLLAPVAMQRLAHPEGERAAARAAARTQTTLIVSSLSTTSLRDVAQAAPDGQHWLQIYPSRHKHNDLVDEAAAQGFTAVVVTVDAPRVGLRERDRRAGFAIPPELPLPLLPTATRPGSAVASAEFNTVDRSLTWTDFERMVARSPLPVVIKGVMHPDDTRRAIDAGTAAVIVSNHGGRQLDTAPTTAEVLSANVAAADGRAPVLVDGGIRRGSDVCTALALGATAVLIGRPIAWGLAVNGEHGLTDLLGLLRQEIETNAALLGCASTTAIDRNALRNADS